MLSIFLDHQWKAFWRSRNKAGSVASQIIIGFFVLYFLGIAIVVGVAMAPILKEVFPGKPAIASFNGLILYYFAADFLMRSQLQDLPTLGIVPYLHLSIKRSEIVKFLNVKSLFSAFNFLPIFIFFPFILVQIAPAYGGFAALMYIVAIMSFAFFNNFMALYIKRKSITNTLYTIIGFAILVALGLLDYFKIISIMAASSFVFGLVVKYPLLALVFTAAAAALFFLNSNYLLKNLYVEELSSKTEKKVSTDYAFLNRFGNVGELAALELKLILRHKRPRSAMIMGCLFLFYGFIFYKQKAIDRDAFGPMMFAAIFMTGISVIIYGQFMFAWQSAHFDGLLSSKINFKNFIKAKFLLFTIGCTIVTILATFYGFLSPKLILLQLVAYVYNIGFGTVVVLYLATLNYKRLDINKAASFNYQGTGATQWLLMFPYVLTPILIYLPFGLFNLPYYGLLAVFVFGAIMLLMRNFWVDYLTKRFEKQRYKIAEGFRE